MKTEQEIKEKVTHEIIKKMVKLAEGGFKYDCDVDEAIEHHDFPLLIHRAIEGWNKQQKLHREIVLYKDKVCEEDYKLETHNGYEDYYKYTYVNNYFKDYQSSTLTTCECAMLDCLIEVLK